MNLSPESVKKTLLNKVNELSASSWQYTKKTTDFTRNRKISFSDVLLSTISMQKSASKTELLKYFDFNASAPTASALIQQRKKISPEAFDSLFYSFSNAFFLDKTLKGYDPIAVDGSDIYIPRNPKDPDTYRVTDRYNKGFNMIHLNAAYNLLSHLYTDVILQPLNHINEYIAMCDIIDHYTASLIKLGISNTFFFAFNDCIRTFAVIVTENNNIGTVSRQSVRNNDFNLDAVCRIFIFIYQLSKKFGTNFFFGIFIVFHMLFRGYILNFLFAVNTCNVNISIFLGSL